MKTVPGQELRFFRKERRVPSGGEGEELHAPLTSVHPNSAMYKFTPKLMCGVGGRGLFSFTWEVGVNIQEVTKVILS